MSIDKIIGKLNIKPERPPRPWRLTEPAMVDSRIRFLMDKNPHPGFYAIGEVEESVAIFKKPDGTYSSVPRILMNCLVPDPSAPPRYESERVHKGKDSAYHRRIQKKWDRRYGLRRITGSSVRVISVSPGTFRKLQEAMRLATRLKGKRKPAVEVRVDRDAAPYHMINMWPTDGPKEQT